MPDDARTRGIDVIVKAFGLPNETFTAVSPRQAVDALIAAGWAPPPAPASDDATARYLEWRRVREDAIARAGGSCASDDVKARARVAAYASSQPTARDAVAEEIHARVPVTRKWALLMADAVLAALGIHADTPLPFRIVTQVDDADFRMAVCEVIDDAIYNLIDDEDSRIAKRIIPALAKAGLLAAKLEASDA